MPTICCFPARAHGDESLGPSEVTSGGPHSRPRRVSEPSGHTRGTSGLLSCNLQCRPHERAHTPPIFKHCSPSSPPALALRASWPSSLAAVAGPPEALGMRPMCPEDAEPDPRTGPAWPAAVPGVLAPAASLGPLPLPAVLAADFGSPAPSASSSASASATLSWSFETILILSGVARPAVLERWYQREGAIAKCVSVVWRRRFEGGRALVSVWHCATPKTMQQKQRWCKWCVVRVCVLASGGLYVGWSAGRHH
mgnify:CR=1 FL=1